MVDNKEEKWKRYRKEYMKEYNKKYRVNNKEKLAKSKKEYRKNNKGKIKEYLKKNKEKTKEQRKEYYENNRKKFKGYHKKQVEIENKRRKKLGLLLVGEGWTSEKELLNHVYCLFPTNEIIFHCRSWIPIPLELDIYLPELELAFEYNGIQHYKWNKFFHKTKAEFEYQQYKDKIKKKICKQKGITLIRIKYNEKLSEQLVLSKLKHFNFPIVQKKIL